LPDNTLSIGVRKYTALMLPPEITDQLNQGLMQYTLPTLPGTVSQVDTPMVEPSLPPTSTITATSTPTPTPTLTLTPSMTPTLTFTPTITPTFDPSPNAQIIILNGNTSTLVTCTGTYFAFQIVDPEGVKRAYVVFTSDSRSYSLELTNISDDTWGGTFDDHISRARVPTFYTAYAEDLNGSLTKYRDQRYSFYSRTLSCF